MQRELHLAFTIITWLLTFQIASRGLDYLTGNPRPGVGAFEVGWATPAASWGAGCLVAAAVVVVGALVRSTRVVRAGAVLAMSLYLAFAVMVSADVLRSPLDDWRFFTSYLVIAGTWGTIAWVLTTRIAVEQHREEATCGVGAADSSTG
ncbi:hypothetical protein [Corynebacterium sp.]|uniref:hypothetical protein n=1 Tax=Corynebacterium sp. TaxID=1720 RepID=UPI002A91473A|nr:hypothetical protein [Corynebacterium sp.]MDY5784674.1 hypothetical protein [Corynebacterium sp.]